ncbi:MAG: hypothetical protein GEV03_26070 [Streptosporangiales bacterium]|nr:hypothetical protein [Streptosporangiales bacterium]
MDLTTYADLAVRLVNTADPTRPELEELGDLEALREFLRNRPHLRPRVTRQDLDGMRALRNELREVFEAVERGDDDAAIDRLNALLVQHPVHPQISGHDGQRWHMHLTESGSVTDQYAAQAAMGLAILITTLGIDRLGVCQASPCREAFLDTSTNRSRRYCSERCASRANVAAYRARQREATRQPVQPCSGQ